MKKILYMLLMTITAIALYGCDNKNDSIGTTNKHENTSISPQKTGNTPGNILAGGYLAEDNGWIYYPEPDDSSFLYRIKTDRSGKQKLENQEVRDINVNGEWIYYQADKGIYRMKKDGSSKELICPNETFVSDLNYYDGSLYFEDEDLNLYKMNLDTNQITCISDKRFQEMVIIDGWIYYISYYKNKLKRCTINGTDFQTLSPHSVDTYTIDDGNIYFQDGDDYCLYRMTMDGSNITKLKNDFVADSMHIIDGTLYYLAIGTQVCSLNLDSLQSNVYRKTNDVIDLNMTEHAIYYRYVKNRRKDSEDIIEKFELVKKD